MPITKLIKENLPRWLYKRPMFAVIKLLERFISFSTFEFHVCREQYYEGEKWKWIWTRLSKKNMWVITTWSANKSRKFRPLFDLVKSDIIFQLNNFYNEIPLIIFNITWGMVTVMCRWWAYEIVCSYNGAVVQMSGRAANLVFI